MRKEYRKAVRERFARGMADRFPHFELTKVDSPILFGGESVFRWEKTNDLHCFVVLVPDLKGRQAFTLELGWSRRGRFPAVSMRPSILYSPDDPVPVDTEEAVVRLGGLVSGTDLWWSLPDRGLERPGDLGALEASLERIPGEVARQHARAPVEAALDVLEEHGPPLFDALSA